MTDTNTAERIPDEMVHAALKAKNPTLYRDHLRHPSNGPVLSASTENEIQVTRKMLEAAFQAGRASLAASAGSEPVIGWHAFPHYRQHPDGRLLRTASDLLARHGYTGCAEPLRAMSDALLSTHPSPPEGMAGWISVDERLPQPFTTVLIHPRPTGYCCEGEVNTQRQWSYGEYETGFGHHQIKCKVTHWQPLPAPPLPASEAKEL